MKNCAVDPEQVVVTVNGQPYQVPWSKRTVIPLPPGQYHLHVHVPYLIPTQVGKADLPINVGGGRPIELEYKAPLWAFSPGSLGTPPQKYNGVLATVLIMVIPLAILLILGGIFSFLPVLGVWMLPLGLAVLAVDVPPLKKPVGDFLVRLQRWISILRRKWRRNPA